MTDDLAQMLKIVRANGWDRNLSAKEKRKFVLQIVLIQNLKRNIHSMILGLIFVPQKLQVF